MWRAGSGRALLLLLSVILVLPTQNKLQQPQSLEKGKLDAFLAHCNVFITGDTISFQQTSTFSILAVFKCDEAAMRHELKGIPLLAQFIHSRKYFAELHPFFAYFAHKLEANGFGSAAFLLRSAISTSYE